MHEVSLGGTIRDYLTGEELLETTYEEFRQALAKLLVEERGYPKDRLRSKVELGYEIDGDRYSRAIDLVLVDEAGKPLLVVVFCSGKVGSFERETAVAARLINGGPAPLALVTDTMNASLMDNRGHILAQGMQAIPVYESLLTLASYQDVTPLTDDDRVKLSRIFHTYCGFLVDQCCSSDCKGPVKG
ncbi:MAG: type I restriction enzyme HsdR N-terminal domain-containing protein [Proteobacteria bacterium]|nr:type I restriction enzyme HsdR N-terminal domain-containing protein [Pseudomonadota bacterium]